MTGQYSNIIYHGNDYEEKQKPKKLSQTEHIHNIVSELVERHTANLPETEDFESVVKAMEAADGES